MSTTSQLMLPERVAAVREIATLQSYRTANLDRLCRLAAAALGTPMAAVTLLTDTVQIFAADFHVPSSIRKQGTAVGESFCQHVVETGRVFSVDDALTQPMVCNSPLTQMHGWRAYLGAPLRTRTGHVYGALCVVATNRRSWSPTDAQTISDLASLAAEDIARTTSGWLTEWARLGEEPVPMYIADEQTRGFLAVNDAALVQYGYTRAEFLSMRLDDLSLPSALRGGRTELRKGSAGFSDGGLWTHRKKDGSLIEVQLSRHALMSQERPAQIFMAVDITAALNKDAAKHARERYFESLIENVTDVVSILDVRGRIQYVSPAVQRSLGYDPNDLVGMDSGALIHPDDKAMVVDVITRHQSAHLAEASCTYRCRHKNGEWRLIESKGRNLTKDPAIQGFVVNSRDITELRRAEERLRHTSAAGPSVLYSLCVRDNAIHSGWVSSNITELFGHTVEDTAANDWWFSNLHPDDRQSAIAATHAVLTTGRVAQEYRFRRKDGSYRWVSDQKKLIVDAEGRPSEIVGSWMDTTEFRHLQAQFLQAQKMEAIGQLAGGIAHDFNNILTAMKGHIELVLEDVPTHDPVRADIVEVRTAADRAAALTRQLLAFSRKQVLRPEVLDLGTIVTDMSGMFKRLISESIDIDVSITAADAHVLVDRSQVEQVVMNLVVNAADAMPRGGRLTVSVGTRRTDGSNQSESGAVPAGAYVLLSVTDTGSGIPADVLPHIFEPFFTTKEAGKGTGLGLATVYGIITQSGGFVAVTSEPGAGTSFEILLPAATERPQTAVARTKTTSHLTDTKYVLVVEDEPQVLAFVRRALQRNGHTVIEAANARDALEWLGSNATHIDVVVTDMVMPEMSGSELAHQLRLLRPRSKVVFMSGYTRDAIVEHGVKPGTTFLEKPFSADELIQAIGQALTGADVEGRSEGVARD